VAPISEGRRRRLGDAVVGMRGVLCWFIVGEECPILRQVVAFAKGVDPAAGVFVGAGRREKGTLRRGGRRRFRGFGG